MTLNELTEMPDPFLTVDQVAEMTKSNPQSIRSQAQSDPAKLGFPVSVIGNRVLIPRVGFLNWMQNISRA